MKKLVIILVLLGVIIGLPFVFRSGEWNGLMEGVEEQLVILTPHNEAVRYEFGEGFRQWYYKKTGKRVGVDWRTPGGSQDAARYVDSVYTNAFKLYWERDLGRKWDFEVQEAFGRRVEFEGKSDSQLTALEREVRDAFWNSNVGSGIDLFFGGGKVDVVLQGLKGQIVPSGIAEKHPEWFQTGLIPQELRGNTLWDENGLWLGTALSGFGIIYNRDVLDGLDYEGEPKQWMDLGKEVFFGEVAVTDPTASGAFTMVFEIIIQQQIQEVMAQEAGSGKSEEEMIAIGWSRGMQLIQRIAANARYFTDAGTKPVLDVASGDCAVGMAIDFYGLFQIENLRSRSGSQRFGFVMPKGGSAVSPDPIALFRGAPHKELALAFIEYVLSLEGQKLWDYKVGEPGGPKQYALSRAPIRKELYSEEYNKYRSNAELDLYRDTEGFTYHPEWTAGLFKELRFVIRAAFIDVHEELVGAWKAIIDARAEGREGDAEAGQRVMGDLKLIGYDEVVGKISRVLHSGDPLDAIKLRSELSNHYRRQYKWAEQLAKKGDSR